MNGMTIGTSGTAAARFTAAIPPSGGRNVVVSRSRRRMTHDLATSQNVPFERG
jgi:hypothetical protein